MISWTIFLPPYSYNPRLILGSQEISVELRQQHTIPSYLTLSDSLRNRKERQWLSAQASNIFAPIYPSFVALLACPPNHLSVSSRPTNISSQFLTSLPFITKLQNS